MVDFYECVSCYLETWYDLFYETAERVFSKLSSRSIEKVCEIVHSFKVNLFFIRIINLETCAEDFITQHSATSSDPYATVISIIICLKVSDVLVWSCETPSVFIHEYIHQAVSFRSSYSWQMVGYSFYCID